jgi:hypothetical protein
LKTDSAKSDITYQSFLRQSRGKMPKLLLAK